MNQTWLGNIRTR